MTRRPWPIVLSAAAAALALSACSSEPADPSGRDLGGSDLTVEIPGASGGTDFDDLSYSRRLDRVLVPALDTGVALIEPETGTVRILGDAGGADSVTEGGGLLFLLDKGEETITVADPQTGQALASAETSSAPDYVRYVASTRELWVTEPGSGIEVFRLEGGEAAPTPIADGTIPIEDGSEGLVIDEPLGRAYTQRDTNEAAVVDLESRELVTSWPTGCDGVHGLPQTSADGRFLLAGCADAGEVPLLDAKQDGKALGAYRAGGGEAVLAYSARTGHFYARGDPGDTLTVLAPSRDGLKPLGSFSPPSNGHCLVADDSGHIWACDPDGDAIQRFTDSRRSRRWPGSS